MRIIIIMLALVMGIAAMAGDAKITPVKTWPKVVRYEGKTYYNVDQATCVMAGYRLLGPEPVTPQGKRVKTREIIQDPEKVEMAKIVCTYEDIPEPPAPPPPEVLTNVLSNKVTFQFNTNGVFRSITWTDAPVTNVVIK